MNLILKIIYIPFINFFLRNMIRLFSNKKLISVSGKLNLKYRDVTFHLYTNQTCYVTKVLFYDGVENYEFTPIIASLIKKSKVFMDIGANIGLFSVLSAKLNHNIQAYAFEPSRGALHYLNKNVISNKLNNVNVIGKAVADIDGELEFHDVINPKYPWLKHYLNGSNSLQNKYGKERTESYKVPTTTLAKVVEDYNIQQIDLIKLDTEFTEHIILKNSLGVLKKFRPILISEIYTEIEKEVQLIIDELEDYNCYHIDNNHLYEINNLYKIDSNDERNFIFCPNEKVNLLNEFLNQ
ncbi:MAG: FkbM family methyltransferase [Chitinophagales bacterium]